MGTRGEGRHRQRHRVEGPASCVGGAARSRVPPRAVRGRESRRGRGRGGSGRACGCCNWSSLSHRRAGAPRLSGVGHHGEHVLSNLLGRVL